MARQTAAPDAFGPFRAPDWLTPTSRLAWAAFVGVPFGANVLFWPLSCWISGDVTWGWYLAGSGILLAAAAALTAYGRRLAVHPGLIAGSVLALIPTVPFWAVVIFSALVGLSGGLD